MTSFRAACGAVLALCGIAAPGQSARAGDITQLRTFHVDAGYDKADANPGDGVCNWQTDPDKPPVCTLRAAIMEANTLGDGFNVEITLKPDTTYLLQLQGAAEQLSKTGDLDILRPMRIGIPNGAEPRARIDAHGLDRAFHFGDTAGSSKLYGLTIYGGFVSAGNGAAIYSSAPDLVIESSSIEQNALKENEVLLLYVSAVEVGQGMMTLRDSQISANGTSDIWTAGLVVQGIAASANVERSAVAGNSHGGILVLDYGKLEMSSSTVSGNSYIGVTVGNGGAAAIRGSSIVSNDSDGLYLAAFDDNLVSVDLRNSIIVAGDSSEACNIDEQDDLVQFTSEYNIYSDGSCSSDTLSDHSQSNVEAGLSDLGDWGGQTPTHKPLPGSIAIDWAPASLCAEDGVDQRGFPRPVAHIGNVEPRCDAGAVELEALVVPDDPWTAEIFFDGFEDEG